MPVLLLIVGLLLAILIVIIAKKRSSYTQNQNGPHLANFSDELKTQEDTDREVMANPRYHDASKVTYMSIKYYMGGTFRGVLVFFVIYYSTGVGTRGAGCAIAPPLFLNMIAKTLAIVVSSGL